MTMNIAKSPHSKVGYYVCSRKRLQDFDCCVHFNVILLFSLWKLKKISHYIIEWISCFALYINRYKTFLYSLFSEHLVILTDAFNNGTAGLILFISRRKHFIWQWPNNFILYSSWPGKNVVFGKNNS